MHDFRNENVNYINVEEHIPSKASKPLVQMSKQEITQSKYSSLKSINIIRDVQSEHIKSGDISPPGEWFSLNKYAEHILMI